MDAIDMLLLKPGEHRRVLCDLLERSKGLIRIASAYVTDMALLESYEKRTRLLTSFDAMDLISGATSLMSLASLSDRGAQCRLAAREPKLHAKVYIVGDDSAIITSANLTRKGLDSNLEAGHQLSGPIVGELCRWFDSSWQNGRQITASDLRALQQTLCPYLARFTGLRDEVRSELPQSIGELLPNRSPVRLKNVFDGSPRYFCFNTNRTNEKPTADGRWELEAVMQRRECAVVWTKFKHESHMERVKPGDIILAFAKGGVGVIGIGRATSRSSRSSCYEPDSIYQLRDHRQKSEDPNKEECRIQVEWLEWRSDSDACRLDRDSDGMRRSPPTVTFLDVTEGAYAWIPKRVKQHFVGT